jgi:hypothetical protein
MTVGEAATNFLGAVGIRTTLRSMERAAFLADRLQQMSLDRVMFAPIVDYRTLRGVGPRIAELMLDSMHLIPFRRTKRCA